MDSRLLAGHALGDNATAVAVRVDLVGLIDTIRRLLPGTTHVVVVAGSSPIEQYWAREARREWRVFDDRLAFTWLDSLTVPQIQQRVASLPAHTAVAFTMMDIDAAGVPYEQNEALARICSSADAPVFGFFTQEVGLGVVGGQLLDAVEVGAKSARMAVRILHGESPGAIPPVVIAASPPVFDGRQLEWWKIDESRLPPGSEVRFRTQTFWQAYQGRIIAVCALCALEAALIVILLLNRARLRSTRLRLKANETHMGELQRELNHVDRVSLLGQFSVSLAHEIGQPLGAILRNAEAAELFLATSRRISTR